MTKWCLSPQPSGGCFQPLQPPSRSPPVAIADTAPAAVSHERASASSQHQWAPTLVHASEIFEAFLLAFLWQSPILLMDCIASFAFKLNWLPQGLNFVFSSRFLSLPQLHRFNLRVGLFHIFHLWTALMGSQRKLWIAEIWKLLITLHNLGGLGGIRSNLRFR